MKLNKDLIEKLKNGHIAIDNQRNPNVELLRAVLKEAFPFCSWNAVGNCINYSKNRNDNDWTSVIVDLPTIPLNDFLEKEQFPKDDFGVIVENNNGKEIVNYLASKGFIRTGWDGSVALYAYGVRKDSKDIIYINSNTFSKTYTLQQLKNLENNMENKEIIDYKILPEFLNSVELLCSIKLATVGIDNFRPDSQVYRVLSRNKVLDLWATPVYKSKKVVITVNNTVINIKGDRMVAEGKEFDIKWLTSIRELFSSRTSEWFWQSEVETIKIGCKTGWTKEHLDEIITAYNELQKQK